ncbi:MAG TPA: NAD(P)-dependent alcohol dehydrogenase [Steroidobacteraceae bacterium]|nr:NAD(P)-dependent alcohol dehydrogenase [Steroidobacteraceae bacterium]
MKALIGPAVLLGLMFLVVDSFAAPTIPATTRKVVLEKTDSAYRWKVIEAPVPEVGDTQVLVHVRAVALNRGDWELLEEKDDYTGRVPVSDAAGDAVVVGKAVKGIRVGQRVTSTYFRNWADGPPDREKMSGSHGYEVDGVMADYVLLEDAAVVPVAAGLSYEEAATLPTAGLTAWSATVGHHDLRPGSVVLVQGTGGVSIFALQFAASAGARVIVTSSSDEKLRRAQELGAQEGINYKTTPDWSARVLELTSGHGADLVVDVGGKDTLAQSVKSVAYLGTVAIVGGLTGYGGNIPAAGLLNKTARAQGVFVGSRADFLRMNAYITRHKLHPVIDRVFPFEQYQDALAYLKSGNFVGKVVLRLQLD